MKINHHETTPAHPLVPSLSKDGAPQSKEASPMSHPLGNV